VFSVLLLAVGGVEGAGPRLEVPFTDVAPRLEEFLDMRPPPHLAGKLARVSDFIQRIPHDGAPATFRTEVYVAYDHERLYAVFVAFDDEPQKIRANLAPRASVRQDDTVNIMIDTFNDQRRAYFFLSNPLGVQLDGQFIEGRGFDDSFEAVWDSQGRVTDRGFVVKIEIPFDSIRFPRTVEQTWRVIFNRELPRLGQDTFWPHYSLAIEGRLNQTALLTGIRDVSPGRNMQIVPYAFFRDYRLQSEGPAGREVENDDEEALGLDFKMVVEDAWVLDLTANPDFSQIESDEPQATVNQRFELFFPERRPFFLENSDLFQTPTNLLFTRRIVDPAAGVRLTGKRGAWAFAALVADDEAPGKDAAAGDPLEDERAHIGVLRASRDISDQSRIGALFTDRELEGSRNRVGAVDGRIKLDDNWVAQFQVAAAGSRTLEGEESDGVSYNAALDREGTHWTSHTHYLYTSPGFRTDLGFLGAMQRPDSQNLHNNLTYRFRPAASRLNAWGPNLFFLRALDASGRSLDWSVAPQVEWTWAGETELLLGYEHLEERLMPAEFDSLAAPRDFSQDRWKVEFGSDRWLRWGFDLAVVWGTRVNFVPPDGAEPELADLVETRASVLWRPVAPLRLDLFFVRTDLDDDEGATGIFSETLVRARANWQFTKELSLRLIADLKDLDPVAGKTSLTDDERLTVDALVRYLWNPWQALYVGYTSNERDFQEFDDDTRSLVDSTDEGRQFFVKFSYLFQL